MERHQQSSHIHITNPYLKGLLIFSIRMDVLRCKVSTMLYFFFTCYTEDKNK